jgi:hypothetical protein
MAPRIVPVLICALSLCWLAPLRIEAAEPRVDLDVVVEQALGAAVDGRAWTEMLSQAGFSTVRLRSGNDSPSLQTTGAASSPAYKVIGVLTEQGQLLLPKGRFAIGDRARLEQWVRKLRDDGEEGVTTAPAAFGLLPRQLVAVHEALAAPVTTSTAGKPPREVAKQIAAGLTLKFTTDAAGQRALDAEDAVIDELQGLSSGTALAAILRPLGLALVPEKNGNEIRLRITDAATAKEQWPVGWPPKGNPSETLPELFKFLNVDIDKTPLAEALAAIAGRVKAPLLYDYNALARAGVDLNGKVSLPKTNTYYIRAMERLLSQQKLKYELRVDEANKPLLWVTTIRQ